MRARQEISFECQLDLDPAKLVFIDEAGALTKMARTAERRDASGCGLGCSRSVMPKAGEATSIFVSALRLEGMTAPMVLDGPMTAAWFLAYAEQVLAPTLKPGYMVILDNLSAAIRQAIESTEAQLLFLPPYSLNPTSLGTPSPNSKRCSAKPPHAPSRPSGAPNRDAIDAITPTECASFFDAAGLSGRCSRSRCETLRQDSGPGPHRLSML